jgi:hypothetical protein
MISARCSVEQQAFETGSPFGNPGRVDYGPSAVRPAMMIRVRRYDPRSAPARRSDQPVVACRGLTATRTRRSQPPSPSIWAKTAQRALWGVSIRAAIVAFEEFIDASPELTTLTLHSPGGSVRDAIAMAELLREREIDTAVARTAIAHPPAP